MSNAVSTKTFSDLIKSEGYRQQIAMALPKGLTQERMVRVVITALNKTPKLLECSHESLWQSVLDCAALGLLPDPLGRAYLVPYGKICQLIIGYKGLVDLAYRSERIGMIQVAAVHKGDHWHYELGLRPKLEHRPGDEPGELTHVYSIVHIKGCDMPSVCVMTKREVDAIRARSMAKNNGPWVTDYEEMAKKTVFRRHSKVIPMSSELASALAADGDAYDDEPTAEVRSGRFAKDNGTKTIDVSSEVNNQVTESSVIALAKSLPDSFVAGIMESLEMTTIGGSSPEKLAALYAKLTEAKAKGM